MSEKKCTMPSGSKNQSRLKSFKALSQRSKSKLSITTVPKIQRGLQNIHESQHSIKVSQLSSNNSKLMQENINDFLKHIHTAVQQTFLQEDKSQIIENIHFAQLNSQKEEDDLIGRIQMDDLQKQNQGNNKLGFVLIEALMKIQTLGQLQQLVEMFNPQLGCNMVKLIEDNRYLQKQNIRYRQQIQTLKRQKHKLSVKYKILQNQTRIFQENNAEISKNYANILQQLNHLKHGDSKDCPIIQQSHCSSKNIEQNNSEITEQFSFSFKPQQNQNKQLLYYSQHIQPTPFKQIQL